MIDLHLIGIGTGNPDHLTRAAVQAMNAADLILLPRKGDAKADLIDLRRTICAEVLTGNTQVVEFDLPVRAGAQDDPGPTRDRANLSPLPFRGGAGGGGPPISSALGESPHPNPSPEGEGLFESRSSQPGIKSRADADDYLGAVNDWHHAIAQAWSAQIARHLPDGGRLALLVWGDPSLYDSTLRIAERLRADGMALRVHVVPGITSLQALTAAHAIGLNTLAEPVLITTGRRLREQGWPGDIRSVAVMLDSGCAFGVLASEGITIWWGAYLGMAHEALIHGPLSQAAPLIAARRAELRARHGWIMDIYLMRKDDEHGT